MNLMLSRCCSVLCLALCAAWLHSCSAPKDLVFKGVQNFSIQSLGLSNTRLGGDIRYYNPNGYALDLKDGDISVFINDRYAGKAELSNRISIPALAEFNIPISLTADLKSVLQNAVELLLNPEVNLKLQGHVRAGRGGVFIRVPVDYVTRQRIQIR